MTTTDTTTDETTENTSDDLDETRDGDQMASPVSDGDADAPQVQSEKERRTPELTVVHGARGGARRSISVRALAVGIMAVALVATIGGLGWKVHAQSEALAMARSDADGRQRAEQVAMDYSTGAAQMDYRDENGWLARLTKGTSPELANRLRQAADSMQQLTVPMQWTSTAQPIAAKVVTDNDGIYQVVCFVDVNTKNVQARDGIQSTATYRVTVNSHDNWQITEISGIGPAAANKPAGG